jgi:hypothetical protein
MGDHKEREFLIKGTVCVDTFNEKLGRIRKARMARGYCQSKNCTRQSLIGKEDIIEDYYNNKERP